ncbi:MAG TPA: ammonia-forming cytochrome c nitrite reductase subunit c552 [Syntrophorhabdaceae bacterium]|nr:ammonia-forming cytochrome c nitrite reductase subunit c552 [Syntrophorhabdaceae bacterium]
MNKKIVFVFVIGIIFVFAALVMVRSFFLKPSDAAHVAAIPEGEYDPAVWGRRYSLQYASFQKNLEMSASPTDFGGSVKFQHSLRQSEILTNFKGNAFSKDYTEDRGHPYSLTDLKESKRVTPQTPGACMTCKTANIPDIFKELGWSYANKPLAELFAESKHAIGCANCHNPLTMELRVTNPAFVEAMAKRGIDVTKAPREEMRTYVCGQCHAEYYFEPGTSRVIMPWDKGFHPEQIYAYYSTKPGGFEGDWVQPDSQAIMLKAQHPDFEVYSAGTHARLGISCADCHMPYMREAGRKYSSHRVTSPMKTTDASCRRCHPEDAKMLLERVRAGQKNVWELQHIAGTRISKAHEAISRVITSKTINKEDLDKAREHLRRAHWYWDFVAAENSMGFHNPALCLNILGQSIDLAHRAAESAALATGPVP